MAKTYLELVNIVLRDINEVALTSPQFNSPRGLQALVKEVVNRAYADVLNYSKEWPFLSESNSLLLSTDSVELQKEYYFDSSLDHVDWDSFYITSSTGSYQRPLITVDIDYYTKHLRKKDSELSEGSTPTYVYRLKTNNGFGLSPAPDDVGYTITYAAWKDPSLLVNSTDVTLLPDRYYTVLSARARYYIWMFRENAQQASFALNEYENSIKKMHRDLVEKQSVDMRAV